ncbi:MAG: FkbM family methyltransferase [Thermoproteota archaeon]|nr:FkbM family methyltransferase [Thermoproteota archaeon]
MINNYTSSSYLEYAGSNKWWLREVKGARVFDKLVVGLLKSAYLGTRFFLRLILGRKRRDNIFLKRNINFKDFLYSSTKILGVDKALLLEIHVPNHDYHIHCPLNKEDFIVMTKHEEEIIGLFRPREGDTVVDIGAHMGRYTITSSKSVGGSGRVIAVEAHPYNFRILQHNIRLNKLKNVNAVNWAVYSKRARLKLYLPDEYLGYTMHHSLMTNYLTSKYSKEIERRFIEVEADTLDNLLKTRGIDEVNWIKIDVEGAEYEVLRGAREILSNNKRISILVEVHGKDTYHPTMELLRSNNFNIEFEKTYDNGEKHVLARKLGA